MFRLFSTLKSAFSLSGSEQQMNNILTKYTESLSKLASTKANPMLLESMQIPDLKSQLKNIADVSIKDQNTLTVHCHDTEQTSIVERTIRSSPLGLNPQRAPNGSLIVPLPKHSIEKKQATMKQIKEISEQIKVKIRLVRQGARNDLKKSEKTDTKKAEKDIQKLTDNFIEKVDKISKDKENEFK